MNSKTGEYEDNVENDTAGYVPVSDDYTKDDDVPHRTLCDMKAYEYGHKLLDLGNSFLNNWFSVVIPV